MTSTDHLDAGVTEELSAPLLLNPEALLLCGLMWADSDHPGSSTVCEVLTANDFYDPHYGHLFDLIVLRRADGLSTDPASLRSALNEQGNEAPIAPHTAQRMLIELTTLGVTPDRAAAYADQVLGTSYRRQFQSMAQALAHAADTAPEADLFDIMVTHGRAQREAWKRRQAFRTHNP